jgi:hypothetical protein
VARHKRETSPRRLATLAGNRTAKIAIGAAAAVTVPAVALGVVHGGPGRPAASIASPAEGQGPPAHGPARLDPQQYDVPVSRTFDRAAARTFQHGLQAQRVTARAVERAHVREWATVDLNLWSSSEQAARRTGLLKTGKRVLVTGRTAGGRVEVVVGGQSRWVTAGYLSADRPVTAAGSSAGLSMAPCPDGSVEYRLTPAAIHLYRSVCHAFPQITSYGGWDAHGEHVTGKALDIMTSDVTLGNAIAAWLQAHASELHVYDILWRQHIWTPVRASEGWRLFADRGSPTANHMDHVHIMVN